MHVHMSTCIHVCTYRWIVKWKNKALHDNQSVHVCHSLCTATQMWCLARMLPLMIGKDVPEFDEHWSNYLLLLEILDYVFAQHVKPCLT